MAMDESGLGKVLQKARQDAGLTQQQLCSRANLSFSTLTKIERGAIKSPSIFTIQAIAGALGLTLDDLMGNSSPNQNRNLQKTKSGASFIYFDVNGCLVSTYQRGFDKLALDVGSRPEVVEAAFWHYNDQVCRGSMSLEDFNAYLANTLGVDRVAWQDYYLSSVEPIKEMHSLFEWTAEHYRVGLLSNTMPTLISSMRREGVLPQVNLDAVVDSSEVRAIKPEEKIFEIAEAKAGCPASEILLIDDDRANIMAAERMGWHVLSFDHSRPKESVERARQALEPEQN
jgi:FMN phosphatase YigB (HAD superfamily)/DNA-binding XRE family transcriptional regulator